MRTTILAPLVLLSTSLFQVATAADGHPIVPSITVVGSGEVSARPDMAEIQVGVVSQAATAAKALQENNDVMAKLLKTLSGAGIGEKDVQTSNFSVMPQYRHDPRGE